MIQWKWYTQVNNQQKKAWKKNLKDILEQTKQSIEANNYEHPTGTLDTNFHNPAGGANKYVWFGYDPQKIFEHNRGQVLLSMNADLINSNKSFNIQQRKYDNYNSK